MHFMGRPMNEIEASQKWFRRGKKYCAGTLEAMGQLYGEKGANLSVAERSAGVEHGKPGHDPKGVKRKNGASKHG